jgi:flagellar biogenesis protein FliO
MKKELQPDSSSASWPFVRAIWKRVLRLGRRGPRRLRLCESLPLGERRFVAVVEFDEARFLLGGTSSSLVLLSRLADEQEDDSQHPRANRRWEVRTNRMRRQGD